MSAPEAGGLDATLNGEDEDDFFDLQIVKHYDEEVSTPNLMDSFQNDMGSSKMCKNTLHYIFLSTITNLWLPTSHLTPATTEYNVFTM